MSKPVFEDIVKLSGRRNRKSYFLYSIVVTLVLAVVWGVALLSSTGDGGWSGIVVALLVSLPIAISGWAVAAQRCRDFGWTGWAVLITLIPYIGWIFGLVILFIPGNQGSNRYGPDPLQASDR